jgi:hypothetical protein
MNSSLKGNKVHFDESYLHVELADKRIISTPMEWYPQLCDAPLKQLRNYRFICRGSGIEWPDIDYHLSIAAMLNNEERRLAA